MPFSPMTGVLPVTCEVGLSRSVRAFHIMPGMPGPEGQLHDHDYRIEIVVDREQLDDRGMVCDLDVLEAALAELTSRVDGRSRRGTGRAGVGNPQRVRRIPRTMLTICLITPGDLGLNRSADVFVLLAWEQSAQH